MLLRGDLNVSRRLGDFPLGDFDFRLGDFTRRQPPAEAEAAATASSVSLITCLTMSIYALLCCGCSDDDSIWSTGALPKGSQFWQLQN